MGIERQTHSNLHKLNKTAEAVKKDTVTPLDFIQCYGAFIFMKIEPNFEDLKQCKAEDVILPKLKIHYAVKDLKEDIPFIEIDSMKQFYDAFMCSGFFDGVRTFEWIKKGWSFDESITTDRAWKTVFSASIGNQIFVTESLENAKMFIVTAWNSYDLDCISKEITDVWIMEWESFEEAYKYCLDFKEVSPMCYS